MERKRRRLEERNWSKRELFIAKLKESMQPLRRQPKWTSFQLDIEEDALMEWSKLFNQHCSFKFDEEFPLKDKFTQKITIWKIIYDELKDDCVLKSEDCVRSFGRQSCKILISTAHLFEVSLHGMRTYEFLSHDNFGKQVIQDSVNFFDHFYLTVKFQSYFIANEFNKT